MLLAGKTYNTPLEEVPEARDFPEEEASQLTTEFYSLERILRCNAQYNVIIGKRSNGKTYATLAYMIKRYINHGEQGAYIRRYREDFKGKRGNRLFENHIANNFVFEVTNGEYNTIVYRSGEWFLAYQEKDGPPIKDPNPFCTGFSLSEMEHDKSTAYPRITTIIFDEFITRRYYLPNEFVLLMNVLSTIIRHRDNVRIFLLANTVNKYCPYFKEMGLGHVTEMELGKIDVYTYGSSQLKVAVERCKAPSTTQQKSDFYFAFNNPHLEMITGGVWEIDLYPHCPVDYRRSDILLDFFIFFNDNLLHAECVALPNMSFIFIHRKTTPLKSLEDDIIFSEEYNPLPNHYRNIRKPTDKLSKKIAEYFRAEKVFYQDNEVGEIVRNYLLWCKTDSLNATS